VLLRRKGKSIRAIAVALGVGKDTIHSAIRNRSE
jgi:hypothetical protein